MWFFSARKTKPKPVVRFGRFQFRPRLEGLEDRCLLSAGALDPTFGNGAGFVTTGVNSGASGRDALIQPDGKIIAAGTTALVDGETVFTAARYNVNGTLDASFGVGGIAEHSSFGPDNRGNPQFAALYPTTGSANDGKIVQEGSEGGTIIVIRYNANGTLDHTFNVGGGVSTAIGSLNLHAGGVAVTSDGKIVAFADDGTSTLVLVRYNTDGSIDKTFGRSGFVIATAPIDDSADNSQMLLQQPDGKLIVESASSGGFWRLNRWNADGTVDTTFGKQGLEVYLAGGDATSAALYPNLGTTNDGKIVVIGQHTATNTWALARFNTDGTLDKSFGNSGEEITQFNGNLGRVSIDPSGRILVISMGKTLARFNADGTPDNIFGSGGRETPLSGSFADVAVYPNTGTANDGNIVVVGQSGNNILVARFLSASSPSITASGYPTTITAGSAGSFTIAAYDPLGNPNPGYTGTIHFTSSDPNAKLPADYTFTAADQGSHTFSATFETGGPQSITAKDTANGLIAGTDGGIVVNVSVSFGATAETISENADTFSIPVNLANVSTVDTSIPYTLGGTASAGSDYTLTTDTTLVIPAGQTTGSIAGTLIPDLYGAGALDPTFGGGTGVVVTSNVDNLNKSANGVLIQPWDNKIIAVGNTQLNAGGGRSTLVRYNADGTLDSTFGSGGVVMPPFGNGEGPAVLYPQAGNANDGKILISDNGVARLNPDGSVDTSFGSGGLTQIPFGIDGLAFLPNGQIMVAGSIGEAIALTRLNADGSIDTSFGTAGTVTLTINPPGIGASVEAIAVQPDGKFVIADDSGRLNSIWRLYRFNANGTLDTSFNKGGAIPGVVSIALPYQGVGLTALTIYPGAGMDPGDSSKIVVAGTLFNNPGGINSNQIGLFRFNADGTPDTSFGQSGQVVTPFPTGGGIARALTLQADGKIVVAAQTITAGQNWNLSLLRYNTDGSLDTSFGKHGIVATPNSAGSSTANGVAIYPPSTGENAGEIVVAGTNTAGGGTGNSYITVARYLSTPSVQPDGDGGAALGEHGGTLPANTLTFTLGTPTNGVLGAITTNTLTIAESPPVVIISFKTGYVSLKEPAPGTSAPYYFTIALDDVPTQPVTVYYQTRDGSAKAGEDYRGVNNYRVTFPAFSHGATANLPPSQDIAITINGDATDGIDPETFSVVLTQAFNATIYPSAKVATGTIFQTTPPAGTKASIADFSAAGPSAGSTMFDVPINLNGPAAQALTVYYKTSDGTAKAGVDYVGQSQGHLTIAAGDSSADLPITILADAAAHMNLTFTITISYWVNSALVSSTANITITYPAAAPIGGTQADRIAAAQEVALIPSPSTVSSNQSDLMNQTALDQVFAEMGTSKATV